MAIEDVFILVVTYQGNLEHEVVEAVIHFLNMKDRTLGHILREN